MNIHQKKLAIYKNRIYFGSKFSTWNIVASIRAMVEAGTLKVTESIYTDTWVYNQKPFTDKESTSTYQGCIDLSVWDGEIEIVVWEGEMTYGERRNRRSTFKLEGDWWLIPAAVKAVEYHFDSHVQEEQKSIEDAEFNARATLLGEEMLKAFDPNKVEDE